MSESKSRLEIYPRRVCISMLLLSLLGTLPAWATMRVPIGDQHLLVSWQDEFAAHEQQQLRDWLSRVGYAATTVYGTLPTDPVKVHIHRHDSSREPVPWAFVTRGRNQRVNFHVNPALPLQSLINDWTAYHEISHLFIPFPGDDDIWFSEGLASYYQNVLRGRSAVLEPLDAWQKLYAGFKRGAADTRMRHLNLAELSPRLHETGSFMRVYWSGARYFLAVDIALRRRGSSLDQALQGLAECCLQDRRQWNAEQLVERLDRIAGGEEFQREYQHASRQHQLGGVAPLFAAVGLTIDDGKVIAASGNNGLYLDIMGPRREISGRE